MPTDSDDSFHRTPNHPPPLPNEGQPIDLGILREHCYGRTEIALALLEEFESIGREQAAVLCRHIVSRELTQLAAVAHALKGGTAIIGARQLSEIAGQIEDLARKGWSPSLIQLVNEFQVHMENCLETLPSAREAVALNWRRVNP